MSDPQPNSPQTPPPADTRTRLRRSRTHFTGGIVLLLVGIFILASNLGFMFPSDWWSFWPWLLIGLGVAQFAWPGALRERMGGYWLVVVGLYGAVNIHNVFGLDWGNSWPIFIIAVGIRVILGGIARNMKE